MSRMLIIFCTSVLWIMLCSNTNEARYLPTRSQENRLSKLKELLQEIFKIDDKYGPQQTDRMDALKRGYISLDDIPRLDENYPILYDSNDDTRISRQFIKPKQLLKT